MLQIAPSAIGNATKPILQCNIKRVCVRVYVCGGGGDKDYIIFSASVTKWSIYDGL